MVLQEQLSMIKPVADTLKVLILSQSWAFIKHQPMDRNKVPKRKKQSCIRKPVKKTKSVILPHTIEEYRHYEPQVVDLRKIELRKELSVSNSLPVKIAVCLRARELICVCVFVTDSFRVCNQGEPQKVGQGTHDHQW